MSYVPDLSSHFLYGVGYCYVGWLGSSVERQGDTDPRIITYLRRIKERNPLHDSTCGYHLCEICFGGVTSRPQREAAIEDEVEGVIGESADRGQFFVEDGLTRYLLPNMVLHYIVKHRYKLPDVVAAAILRSEDT